MATGTNGRLLALSGKRNPSPGTLGVVEEGALADVLLVDGNPLGNVTLIALGKTFVVIMKDGKIYKNTLQNYRRFGAQKEREHEVASAAITVYGDLALTLNSSTPMGHWYCSCTIRSGSGSFSNVSCRLRRVAWTHTAELSSWISPFVSTGRLPSPETVKELVDEAYQRFRFVSDGRNSTVYPALAKVRSDLYGICVVGASGAMYGLGDTDCGFAIMSVSKPFLFALVCERIGYESARAKLGVAVGGAVPFTGARHGCVRVEAGS